GARDEAARATHKSEHERRLVPEAPDDRTDQSTLDDRAKNAKRGEDIAGLRRIEAEAPRRKERERRLKDRERAPVDEVDHQHATHERTAQQRRQIAER